MKIEPETRPPEPTPAPAPAPELEQHGDLDDTPLVQDLRYPSVTDLSIVDSWDQLIDQNLSV